MRIHTHKNNAAVVSEGCEGKRGTREEQSGTTGTREVRGVVIGSKSESESQTLRSERRASVRGGILVLSLLCQFHVAPLEWREKEKHEAALEPCDDDVCVCEGGPETQTPHTHSTVSFTHTSHLDSSTQLDNTQQAPMLRGVQTTQVTQKNTSPSSHSRRHRGLVVKGLVVKKSRRLQQSHGQ